MLRTPMSVAPPELGSAHGRCWLPHVCASHPETAAPLFGLTPGPKGTSRTIYGLGGQYMPSLFIVRASWAGISSG